MGTSNKSAVIMIVIILLSIIYIYNIAPLVQGWGHSPNYENVSVRTTVNVTQSYPEILNITCNNGADITLTAGGTETITCLIEIRDYNGGNTINNTNGTFYYYLNQSSDPDDNNTHYTNTTCTENNTNGYYSNWTCAFGVLYYANNGTWYANLTVKDDYNLTDTGTDDANINAMYALNVTSVINFGDLPVGDTSLTSEEANITNYGNMDINVSVYGFGGDDEVTGAGLAMICEQRNITLPNERYDLNPATAYDSMTSITGASTHIGALTIPQQTDDTQQEINSTYWKLHVNISTNPYGICNGTVVFSAEAP